MKKRIALLFIACLMLCCFVYAYPADFDGWRVLPVRSEEEFNQGAIGGASEQHPHSIARCRANPDIIYWSHDVGHVWRSADGGETWQNMLGIGAYLVFGQSIEVDPVDCDTIFTIFDASYLENVGWTNTAITPYVGLYKSTDGGDNFELVMTTNVQVDRINRHNIAYDITSVDQNGAKVWYAGFALTGLYRSDDYGNAGSWTKTDDIDQTIIYQVQTHPSDGHTVYLATNSGLFTSSSQGTNLVKLGNLPTGEVTSVQINPENPDMIYALVKGNGLYKSVDAGATFTLLKSVNAIHAFMNPGFPDTIYVWGQSSAAATIVTHDGGLTWDAGPPDAHPFPGLGRAGSGWKEDLYGALCGVVPNPEDENEAVGYCKASLWKTTDGGENYDEVSTLFTGYSWGWNNGGIAWDQDDPDTFALFLMDVSSAVTETGGDWFHREADNIWGFQSTYGTSWINILQGDFQPGTDVMVAAAGGYFDRILVRSTNHGDNWQAVNTAKQNYYFVGFHPNEPNIVYAGDKISRNGGTSFTSIGNMPDGATDAQIFDYCYSNPDIVYALSRGKQSFYRSDDQGTTWSLYNHPGWSLFKFDGVTTIALEPHHCNSVFTVSADGDLAEFDGTSWRETGVLDNIIGMDRANFIRGVTLDPLQEGVIYAGTFLGGISTIWRSEDGGYTWEDISYNLPRTGVSSMKVNPHTGELFKGGSTGTWIFPPPYDSSGLIYEKAVSRPSCHDGLMNGDETGVDSGGQCNAATCIDASQCPDVACKSKSCSGGECVYTNINGGLCAGTCRTCSNGYCINDDDSLCTQQGYVCSAGTCVDNCMSDLELQSKIGQWKTGSLSMINLLAAIMQWKSC